MVVPLTLCREPDRETGHAASLAVHRDDQNWLFPFPPNTSWFGAGVHDAVFLSRHTQPISGTADASQRAPTVNQTWLWRSLKNECVYLHSSETSSELRAGVTKWVALYHARTPNEAYGSAQSLQRASHHHPSDSRDVSTVLEAFSSGPERRIGDIDLLMPVEREQVLRGLNDTARPVPCFVLGT
jgi:hypothetical protein